MKKVVRVLLMILIAVPLLLIPHEECDCDEHEGQDCYEMQIGYVVSEKTHGADILHEEFFIV